MSEILENTSSAEAVAPPAPPATLRADDILMQAHDSNPENIAGRAVLVRAGEYLYFGELPHPGESTAQFDEPQPEVQPPVAALPEHPKTGDLFTHDFVTFHRVGDPGELIANRSNLVVHVPSDVEWHKAVRSHLEGEPGTHVWSANGTPSLVIFLH